MRLHHLIAVSLAAGALLRGTPVAAQETPDKPTEEKPAEKTPRGSFLVAPIPIVSPAVGSGIVPVLAYVFRLQNDDTISPPTTIGAAGFWTSNGSRGVGAFADSYFAENRYKAQVGVALGNINYDLYGKGYLSGTAGRKLPLEQNGKLVFGQFMRNVGGNIFVGGEFRAARSVITIRGTGDQMLTPPDIGLTTDLLGLGVRLARDTRGNHFYPVDGTLTDFTADFFDKRLGGDYTFQSYKLTFDAYFQLSARQVLAYNLFLCATGGDAPFFQECIYGTSNELRGYTAGRYLDRSMIATQLEYRLALPWRFGLTLFAGTGGVADGLGGYKLGELLPAAGTGVRFMLDKVHHINLRSDLAVGKDNYTWSMGVGEAF